MKKIFYFIAATFFFSNAMNVTAQTSASASTMPHVKEWFMKKEWLGGLKLQPHKTINKQEFARQYQLNRVYWDKAFAFLKEHDLQAIPVGRHPIDGDNVFAIVTENPTKEYDSTQWESHRNYVDLHYVISGEEKIGVYSVKKLAVLKSYDASKDVANYSGEGKIYDAVPGTFFLFFPSDAHRPAITPGGKKTDKKLVIKIRYTE